MHGDDRDALAHSEFSPTRAAGLPAFLTAIFDKLQAGATRIVRGENKRPCILSEPVSH